MAKRSRSKITTKTDVLRRNVRGTAAKRLQVNVRHVQVELKDLQVSVKELHAEVRDRNRMIERRLESFEGAPNDGFRS